MGRSTSCKAYLIAVSGRPEVYAAVKPGPADAMDAVAAVAGRDVSEVAYVGTLSRRAARTLELKPGEVRRV